MRDTLFPHQALTPPTLTCLFNPRLKTGAEQEAFGEFAVSFGTPFAGLVILVLIKTTFDVYAHIKEHARLAEDAARRAKLQ